MSSSFFVDPIIIEGDALFFSDAHLGAPAEKNSGKREELIIQLLQQHRGHLNHLFLLGDIFDYWFEYKHVVPKGHFRLFNMLYELHKEGVEIYFFTGNHDMWVTDYFREQFGCRIFSQQQAFLINGKSCLVGHGDGIGGKQRCYLLIKHLFAFKPNRIMYSMLHPRQSFDLAKRISRMSRASHNDSELTFQKEEEYQVQFARQVLRSEQIDYFIYGHRHIPVIYQLTDRSQFVNVGDWLIHFSYILFNKKEGKPSLHFLTKDNI